MKTRLLVAMLLATSSFGQAPLPTSNSVVATNVLALYLLAGNLSSESLNGNATPDGWTLARQPILSDPDFVGWDVTNHTFVITPTAAIRVGVECGRRTRPFVLMVEGVPIYLGEFWTLVSSASCPVPVIIADLAVADYFMGVDKVPKDIWYMMGRGDPVLDRLMALARTSPTTNVTLRVEPGYPYSFTAAERRRSDPRIATAVQKLFGGRNKVAN